jgi:hypothetical protein
MGPAKEATMRTFAAVLIFSLSLLALPAATGCSWLSSDTPLANATSGTLDCVKVGATDAAQAAAPVLLNDLIKWATGGTFTWADVLAAFGGLEAVIKDGIAVATCSYDAIAAALEQATSGATQPATVNVALMGRTMAAPVAVRVAQFARTMMAVRGLKVAPGKRMTTMRAAVVTP